MSPRPVTAGSASPPPVEESSWTEWGSHRQVAKLIVVIVASTSSSLLRRSEISRACWIAKIAEVSDASRCPDYWHSATIMHGPRQIEHGATLFAT
eukprot:8482096-Pyramimonas_sp.AAC.1